MTTRALIITWPLLAALASHAAAGPPEAGSDAQPVGPPTLELYVPPGQDRARWRAALEDDLGSGISGGLPLAAIAAAVDLDPERFGDSIGEGYRRFGFYYLEGRPEAPIGIVPVKRAGLVAHQFNCLACHSGREPLAPAGERSLLVFGAPNTTIDFSGWYTAVFGALRQAARAELERGRPAREAQRRAAAQRADGLLALLERPTPVERRALDTLRDAARRTLRREGRLLGPADVAVLAALVRGFLDDEVLGRSPPEREEAVYGHGRTVVQAAYRVLRFDMGPGPFAPIKQPDLFGVRYRQTLLWTGNETYAESIGPAERIARNGMLVPWIQVNPFTREPIADALTLLRFPRYLRMGRILAEARPPAAPAPADGAEQAAFERGRQVYEINCSECHGEYRHLEERTPFGAPGLRAVPQAYSEELVALDEVGTDRAYTGVSDRAFLEAFEETLLARAGLFDGQVSEAYVARPHLGLRFRAPFLHNGSIPNLEALLTPPEERPQRFAVGPRVPFDWDAGGLKQILPAAGTPVRDTTRSGNRAQGHRYGTDLSAADKRALIAYLKRL